MNRAAATGIALAVAANISSLGALGYLAWDANQRLERIERPSADVMAGYDTPQQQINSLDRRIEKLERGEGSDPADFEARRQAQEALDQAKAAQSKADDAYRRVLDICIVNGIC